MTGNIFYIHSYTVYANRSYNTFTEGRKDLIQLPPGTYQINIKIPTLGRYFEKDGVAYQWSQNNSGGFAPLNSVEKTFRRSIAIDQVVLCAIPEGVDLDTDVRHFTTTNLFLPDFTGVSHTTDFRLALTSYRHSTDFITFLPKYILASGEFLAPSYYTIGDTEVLRDKEILKPECRNNLRLSYHQWHTEKKPNTCEE